MVIEDDTTGATTSRTFRKRRSAGFWVLLVFALATSTLIAWDTFVTSPLYEAHWMVSLEKYWLREFSDQPGAKPYTEELLREDGAWLRRETERAMTPPFYPVVYFIPVAALLVVALFGTRRSTRWQYATIVFALAAAACVIASHYIGPRD